MPTERLLGLKWIPCSQGMIFNGSHSNEVTENADFPFDRFEQLKTLSIGHPNICQYIDLVQIDGMEMERGYLKQDYLVLVSEHYSKTIEDSKDQWCENLDLRK